MASEVPADESAIVRHAVRRRGVGEHEETRVLHRASCENVVIRARFVSLAVERSHLEARYRAPIRRDLDLRDIRVETDRYSRHVRDAVPVRIELLSRMRARDATVKARHGLERRTVPDRERRACRVAVDQIACE